MISHVPRLTSFHVRCCCPFWSSSVAVDDPCSLESHRQLLLFGHCRTSQLFLPQQQNKRHFLLFCIQLKLECYEAVCVHYGYWVLMLAWTVQQFMILHPVIQGTPHPCPPSIASFQLLISFEHSVTLTCNLITFLPFPFFLVGFDCWMDMSFNAGNIVGSMARL